MKRKNKKIMKDYVDNTFKSPAILSYCTGFGGLERGIKRALGSVRTVAIVEIEAFIIENLLAGMESGVLAPAPIWPNIKTFDARPFRGKIHGIVGGYPCQPFSNAGNRKGTEDPRHLYPYLERDIEAARPVWCFFENVGGHLSLGFDEVYRSLSGMGYAVEAGLYTAAEVGAPHERERLFILAIRKDWLADTHNTGNRTPICRDNRERPQIVCCGDNKPQLKPGRQCEELADTSKPGLPRRTCGEFRGICKKTGACERCKYGGIYAEAWPARPGEPQHAWEEPRTIKSGMGSTINGYNFREDLLRAYGNSVVEQTAEIAFIDLLKKHEII